MAKKAAVTSAVEPQKARTTDVHRAAMMEWVEDPDNFALLNGKLLERSFIHILRKCGAERPGHVGNPFE
jgi:hypothetical protein